MDKKQLMAGTLAALTVASSIPTTALAAQKDQEKTTIPYAVLAMHNEDEGDYAVSPFAAQAQTIEELQELINNAADGVQTEVVLQDNLSGDVTIPARKDILLKLNGFTLTNVSDNTITNNGTLTIEGTGTVDNISHGKAAVHNNVGGTVILNGGSYTRSQENGQSASASGGNSYYNIVNWGNMTINNGVEVSQTGHFSSMIENGFYDGSEQRTSPKLTINGGSFSGGLNTVKNDDRGVLEIKGGTFTNVSQAAVLNWNDATIDGGTFHANAGAQAVVLNGKINDTMNLGKLIINGGSFTASGNGTVIQEMTGSGAKSIGTVEINDGSFASESGKIIGLTAGNEDAAQINIVKGSFSTSDADAKAALAQYVDPTSELDTTTGTVSALPAERAAASIGAKNYKTFDAALAAAKDGDTIKLEADVQITGAMAIRKALTIDFAGHKLTSAGAGLDVYADLTLKNGTLDAATWCVWVQNGATVNIAKDMTLNADTNTTETNKPAVVVEGSNGVTTPSTVNIEGTVTAINNFAVSGNGTVGKGNVIINIKDGANISSNETAVYMPNTWQLNITGGTITGATGVYIKSGTTSITGGTIIGTADESQYEYKDGGANATGQAVVIDKCGYPGGDPTVELAGGSFVAQKASSAIGSYTGGSDTSNAPVEKFVTGGSFSSSLKDTNFLSDNLKAELQAASGEDPFSYYATVEAAEEAAKQNGGTVTDLSIPAANVAASIGVRNYATLAEAIAAAQTGDVITLKQNVTESVRIPAGTEITLDLAGKNIESDSKDGTVVSGGKLTVKDSTATVAPVVNADHTVTYTSGKIINTHGEGSALCAANGGEIVLESGSVESTSNIAVYAQGNYTPGGAAQNSKVTIKGGYILAQEFAASAQGNGAELDIQDGVLKAKDNAVIGGNGTKNDKTDCGGTIMNISGGTMIGEIKTAGYIACGVYHPQQGELNITGGKFLIKNGVGVLVRAGNANITGGEIITTGSVNGRVGDSQIIEGCFGVVYDSKSKYPGAADADKITVGDTAKIVTEQGNAPVYMRRDDGSTDNKIGVTGGTFSAPVDKEYLEGLNAELKASTGDAPYSYYASLEEANEANEKAGGTGTVTDLREEYTVTLKFGYETADQEQKVRKGDKITLSEPTRTGRWKFLHWVDDNQVTYNADSEYTVTANVTLTAVWESTERTVTLKYEDGTTADGSITAAVDEEITLPTPTRTGNWKFLHWKDDANTYEGGSKYKVTENATLTAVWESTERTVTLKYEDGTTADGSITAAVDEEITLPTPTRTGNWKFLHWKDDANTYEGGSKYKVTENATLTAVWESTERTVTLKYEDGTTADGSITAAVDEEITLPTPTRTGNWKFLHWTDNANTYEGGSKYKVTENATLTAVWESTERTIILDYANNGETQSETRTAVVGDVIQLPTPTRSGSWKFLHWTDGTTTYAGGSDYNVTANATLTAVWENTAPLTVTLNYANNGETQTETRTAAANDVIVLPTPNRSGRYEFLYWTDGTSTYAGGSNYTVTGNVTLTAVWRYIGSSSSSSGSYNPSYAVSVPSRIDNGSVSVTPGSASKGTTVTITVKPDSGYELDRLTVTDQSGNRLSLSDNGNGKYTFTMPSGKVSVDASFAAIQTAVNFRDVQRSDYFYDAVQWAVDKGITEGTSATTFSPNASCTRAQMVTLLWRAAGSPAPKSTTNPFRDVSSSDYYYNAVLWAVENGITTGTGADTFAPNATVTRGQTVTFLYRAAGSPAAGSNSGFSDVNASDYYNSAVAWAAQNGITGGTGNGKFSPKADCTRGQIVTLLYRANN